MSRVKRGVISLKRRRNVLKQVKGYRFGRSTKEKMAREAIAHAGRYSFAHRKDKKADRRSMWTVRINGQVREMGLSYSKVINMLKVKKIELDRKILSNLADKNPETFKRIISSL